MRTTVQIDDDLLRDLKEQAQREGTSLAKLANRVLRLGIRALRQANKPVRPYREKTFRMGEAAFVGLPGEPFVEIGLAIKAGSPFPLTTVFALCNGVTGYVPLAEHFDHGGYEPRTTPYNRLDRSAGATFIDQALAALASLQG